MLFSIIWNRAVIAVWFMRSSVANRRVNHDIQQKMEPVIHTLPFVRARIILFIDLIIVLGYILAKSILVDTIFENFRLAFIIQVNGTSNTKGGDHVSSLLMIEWPNRVEVLVARNTGGKKIRLSKC